jgi:hypothetical protein
MPDLKTALSNAINEWATGDKPTVQTQENEPMPKAPFAVTNNVTRATFEYVLNRPGVHSKAARNALIAQGFKESSITALFSQMRRAGMLVRDADDRYTAVGTEYKPMKASSKIKPKSVKYLTNKPAKAKQEWAPPALVPMPPAPYEQPSPAPVVTTNDVDYLLNTLPIKQARELYDALHKIFGGAK